MRGIGDVRGSGLGGSGSASVVRGRRPGRERPAARLGVPRRRRAGGPLRRRRPAQRVRDARATRVRRAAGGERGDAGRPAVRRALRVVIGPSGGAVEVLGADVLEGGAGGAAGDLGERHELVTVGSTPVRSRWSRATARARSRPRGRRPGPVQPVQRPVQARTGRLYGRTARRTGHRLYGCTAGRTGRRTAPSRWSRWATIAAAVAGQAPTPKRSQVGTSCTPPPAR